MDPTLEVSGAIRTRLAATSAVTALVGTKIFDVAPAGATEPYISIGPSSYQEEYTDCIIGGEIFIQVDCWSDSPAQDEVRKMAGAVRAALRSDLTLLNGALVSLEHWRTDYIVDGASKHASVRFTGYVEEA